MAYSYSCGQPVDNLGKESGLSSASYYFILCKYEITPPLVFHRVGGSYPQVIHSFIHSFQHFFCSYFKGLPSCPQKKGMSYCLDLVLKNLYMS